MSKKLRTIDLQADQEANAAFRLINHGRVRRVKLNVGGLAFHTSDRTLLRDPHSRLADLITDQPPGADGVYHIDHDPRLFANLLNYLRDGAVDIPPGDRAAVREEACYFGLTSMVNWLSVFHPPEVLVHAALPLPVAPLPRPNRWLAETWGRSLSLSLALRVDRQPARPQRLLSIGVPARPLLELLPSGSITAHMPWPSLATVGGPGVHAPEAVILPNVWGHVCYVYDHVKGYLMLYLNERGWGQPVPSHQPPMAPGSSEMLLLSVGGFPVEAEGSTTQPPAPASAWVRQVTLHHRALLPEEVLSLLDEGAEGDGSCEDLCHKGSDRRTPAQPEGLAAKRSFDAMED
eukprot:EG_transcript_14589